MTISQVGGAFRVFSANQTDVGNFTVVVTSTLANLALFSNPKSSISENLKIINPLNPPKDFIYKANFNLRINI